MSYYHREVPREKMTEEFDSLELQVRLFEVSGSCFDLNLGLQSSID